MEENISQVTETPQVPPPPPVPEQAILKPLENKKYSPFLVIIMALVIILSLGTTVYFAYQNMKLTKQITSMQKIKVSSSASATPDPTANWKTYTDPKGGFQFKYPNNWVDNLADAQEHDVALGFAIGNSPAAVYLTISTTKSIDLTTLKICDATTTYPCLNAQAENFTMGGKLAVKADVRYAVTDSDFQIVQTTESPFIQLKMNVSGGGLANTFNQILSTFQFSTPASQIDMSNWKTCTNKQYSFSIKYPSDFNVDPTTCNYAITNFDLVKDINVTNPIEDFRKNWLLSINKVDNLTTNLQQWVSTNLSGSCNQCSSQMPGPISNSIEFDINAHYVATHVVIASNNKVFDFLLSARNPDIPVSSDIRNILNQVLSTFHFIQ